MLAKSQVVRGIVVGDCNGYNPCIGESKRGSGRVGVFDKRS